jgi:hypothetical protein
MSERLADQIAHVLHTPVVTTAAGLAAGLALAGALLVAIGARPAIRLRRPPSIPRR